MELTSHMFTQAANPLSTMVRPMSLAVLRSGAVTRTEQYMKGYGGYA